MNFTQIQQLEDRTQVETYKKMPIAVERGEGAWVWTSDGEKYLDLTEATRFAQPGIRTRTLLQPSPSRPRKYCSIRIWSTRKYVPGPRKRLFQWLRAV